MEDLIILMVIWILFGLMFSFGLISGKYIGYGQMAWKKLDAKNINLLGKLIVCVPLSIVLLPATITYHLFVMIDDIGQGICEGFVKTFQKKEKITTGVKENNVQEDG